MALAKEKQMKFMVMHKADAVSESEPKPTPELLQGVGNLVQGAMEAGRLIDGAGLRASAHRARVKLADGKRSVQRGPYRGERELASYIALLRVKTLDEGVEWGARLAEAAGATEVEVGTVTEPWDLGVAPKPEGEVPLQVLASIKATRETEAGVRVGGPAFERVVAEAREAKVFVHAHHLLPSSRGARIRAAQGSRRVVDGPFAETKELLGGYMVMTFDDKREAIDFAQRYFDIVGPEEVDIREVE